MSKGITIHISGASRFQESEKRPGMYYFELRTGDNSRETLIADRVVVNNEGKNVCRILCSILLAIEHDRCCIGNRRKRKNF